MWIILYVIADGHRDVSNSIEDWIREGLLEESNFTKWDEEFEDTFELEQIVSAMTDLANDNGFEFDITEKELEKRKEKSGNPVSKVLRKMLHEKDLNENKPALGEKLGLLIASEIENKSIIETEETRIESEAEKVIKKIFDLVG